MIVYGLYSLAHYSIYLTVASPSFLSRVGRHHHHHELVTVKSEDIKGKSSRTTWLLRVQYKSQLNNDENRKTMIEGIEQPLVGYKAIKMANQKINTSMERYAFHVS
jgi:hypothetical protein